MNIELPQNVDAQLGASLIDRVEEWQSEVRRLLPNAPETSTVRFDNHYLIDETGTGGFADAGNTLVLAFQQDFTDKRQQLKNLRASYFHESYHIAQGWVGDMQLEPLDEAILEGAATVFERDRADGHPGWGEYYTRDEMLELLDQVRKLDRDYDHTKWKYYDPETHRKWLLYRLGTFVVDEAMRENPGLTIEYLAGKSAHDILKLASL